MEIEVLPDPAAVARRAAEVIAADARAAVASRGRFALAVSGGRTPWLMLRALAEQDVPWKGVHVVQVDEHNARSRADMEAIGVQWYKTHRSYCKSL